MLLAACLQLGQFKCINFLLLRALQMIVGQVGGPWVRSITVTGHSLGGALASICGFDLATKITSSSGTNSEQEFPNDPDLVRLHDSNNAAPTCAPPDNLRSASLATHMHTRPCIGLQPTLFTVNRSL